MATVTYASAVPGSVGAVAYACSRLGFRVFPLRSDTGTPSFTAWPERATADPEIIREWWTGEYAACGVGIATGPESGIWVLDIDVKDADGFRTLRDLTYAHDQTSAVFSRTMTVRTPSGGAHVYFRWDEASAAEGGVRNSTKRLGPGLDVRGIRGYVRAPEVGAYRIVERGGVKHVGITSAPEWLIPLCKKRRASRAEARTNTDARAGAVLRDARWARFESAETLRKLRHAPGGTRNDALNRAAYRLGTLAALHGEPSEDAARAWCLAAMRDIGAGDSESAQLRTFASGWEAGLSAAETAKAADHRAVPEA